MADQRDEEGPASDPRLAVLERAADGIVVVDADGRILLANPAIETMFGYERGELVGRDVDVLVPERIRSRHPAFRSRFLADPQLRPMGTGMQLHGRRRDGTEFDIDVGLAPLPDESGMRILAQVRDVTELREGQRRTAHLAAIVASSSDAIVGFDLEGRVTSWNRAAERLCGYARAEAIDQPAERVLAAWRVEEWHDVFDRARRGERVERFETEIRRKDGALVDVDFTLSPIEMRGEVVGVSGLAHDITEQKLSLETLADAARRLAENEELAQIGSWTWDEASDTVQWSDGLHRLAGIPPLAFGGDLDAHVAVVDLDERDRVRRSIVDAAARQLALEDEHPIKRPDGEMRWVYSRAEPTRDHSGTVVGLRGIWQDVTDRRIAQEALLAALERERAAAAELRAADALKDEFLSIVSHELRTPLTAIIGFGALLAGDEHVPAVLLEPIRRNAQEMEGMVERLLDFTRLEAGRVDYDPVHLRLRAVVADAVDALPRPLDHDIDNEVPADLEIVTDRDALDRVLANLVGNATKFAPAGTDITVSAEVQEAAVLVSVADRGPGVPPELREGVFDRFVQAPDQPKGRRGTGIGLSIVARYVALMGGQVWCDARDGGGAVFRFTIPAARG